MSPVTPVEESTSNTLSNLPQLDTSLPDVPTDSFKLSTGAPKPTNPYSQGTREYDIDQAYLNTLGRSVDAEGLRHYLSNGLTGDALSSDLGGSNEYQTGVRARNEINPITDSEIQNYLNQANIQRTASQNQLSALDPKYNQQFGALQFGLTEQQQAIAQQLASLSQDYDVNSNRLSTQLGQIPLKAFQMANRRGLLDSSIAYDTLGQLATPVQQQLGDLTRAYGNNTSAANQKLQSINEKYQFDRQGLISQREQDAQAIKNALATQVAGFQSQASQAEAQRGAKTFARAGELQDALKQYLLQQGSLGLSQQQLGEQKRQFDLNYALQQQTANKL